MSLARSVSCPVCEESLGLAADAVVSELIVCGTCCTSLEIRSLDPLELVEAPQEEEDWGQ